MRQGKGARSCLGKHHGGMRRAGGWNAGHHCGWGSGCGGANEGEIEMIFVFDGRNQSNERSLRWISRTHDWHESRDVRDGQELLRS